MKHKELQMLDKNQCKYWFKHQRLRAIMSFPFPWNYILFVFSFIVPIFGGFILLALYS